MKLPGYTAIYGALFLSSVASNPPALAHGGGLNAQGCHTNHKTGDYHCHRGGPSSSSTSSRANLYDVKPTRAGGAFRNCAAARAAGAAPVRAGDPGYGVHLDRDGDGIGCE